MRKFYVSFSCWHCGNKFDQQFDVDAEVFATGRGFSCRGRNGISGEVMCHWCHATSKLIEIKRGPCNQKLEGIVVPKEVDDALKAHKYEFDTLNYMIDALEAIPNRLQWHSVNMHYNLKEALHAINNARSYVAQVKDVLKHNICKKIREQ